MALESTGAYAVASPHALASRAGADVLRDGGNAVDAALATAAVLAVVYPNQCSPGGDLVALVGLPDGTAHVLNASGRAPAAVDVDAVRAAHARMPVEGAQPVTVPGVVAGWAELAGRWGSRPLGPALAAAAGLARDGVPVVPGLARDLAGEAARIAADPGLAGVLLADGAPLAEGATLRNPRLADTLDAIADGGPDAFYAGPVAASLVRTLRAHGSAMTIDDLATHTCTVEAPLAARYGDGTYLASGGNTQGGWFLAGLRAVAVLGERLGRTPDPLGPDAGPLALLLARVAVERDAHLGDGPADDALARLLEDDAAVEALVDAALAGHAPVTPPVAPPAGGDTVAIVAADAHGGRVTIIQSVFHAFGAGLLDPRTGVVLHNRGAAFSLDPASPGVLAGGRRPPHTLMPVLVRDAAGDVVGVHGTMGGRAQPQIHTHLALHLALGRTPGEAVSAPRWVVGRMEAGAGPVAVQPEADLPATARAALAATGLPVEPLAARDDGAGHAQLIRAVAGGRFAAASDPRADGAALTDTDGPAGADRTDAG